MWLNMCEGYLPWRSPCSLHKCVPRSADTLRCPHTLHRCPLLGGHAGEARAGCLLVGGRRVRGPGSGRQGCCPQPRGAAGTWAVPGVGRGGGTQRKRRRRKRRKCGPVPHPDCHIRWRCRRCGGVSAGRSVESGLTWGGPHPSWSPESGGEMEGPGNAPPKWRRCQVGPAWMGLWEWKVVTV